MGQSSLIRVPNTTAAPAAKKFIKLMPWWLVRGGGPTVPGTALPSNTALPVATATSLSVAAAGVASVTTGSWTNAPTSYTYQWLRSGVAISGATAASYTFVVADEGNMISCAVKAVNAKGTSVSPAVSNSLGVVTALMAGDEARQREALEPPPPPAPRPGGRRPHAG